MPADPPTTPTFSTIESEAQHVLEELWHARLIPFELKVGKVTQEPNQDPITYTIHFYDSRLHSVSVPVTEGRAFSHLLRAAILARVAQMNSTLE